MADLTDLLVLPKTIVAVGLSDKRDRPSNLVARYLQNQGFKIIPVNPSLDQVLGEKSYPDLSSLPAGTQIDIVDVFRQPAAVMGIVDEILKLGIKPVLWLQEGVIAPAAKTKAEQAGLKVFMDVCLMKEHQALQWSAKSPT